MEPWTYPPANGPAPEPGLEVPLNLRVVLLAIFVLECLVALHTLTPRPVSWVFMFLGLLGGTVMGPLMAKPQKAWWLRHTGALVFGLVAAEAITYAIAVPWRLTLVCFQRGQHDVEATLCFRLDALVLAGAAWRMLHRAADARPTTAARRRSARLTGLALAAGATLPVAFLPVLFTAVQGHRPRSEVMAEMRAAAELGPEYADYSYFVRNVDLVIRSGECITTRASVIAYHLGLNDLREVEVSWKEAWTVSAKPGP